MTEPPSFDDISNHFLKAIKESLLLFIPDTDENIWVSGMECASTIEIMWAEFEKDKINKPARLCLNLSDSEPIKIEINKIYFQKLFNPQKNIQSPLFILKLMKSILHEMAHIVKPWENDDIIIQNFTEKWLNNFDWTTID